MKLKKLTYREFESSHPRFWEIEPFELGQINLIVGSNTAGKSRTLNVILGLSTILQSPKLKIGHGFFDVIFENGSENIHYIANIEGSIVLQESFTLNGVELFHRNKKGEGKVFNSSLDLFHNFSIPKDQLLATRRDSIQFPYLEDLYTWSSNVRHFRFSKEEEKQTLVLIDSNTSVSEGSNQNITNQAIEIFRKGKAEFRDKFVESVIKDFNSIGYNILKIDHGSLHSVKLDSPIGNRLVGLRVFESDRPGMTDQNEMSDGMFRALSLIIHFNYYQLTHKDLTVLVDDIGEGLDFERSTNLIRLSIEKALNSNIQLILSSNDKFVMNNTNLKYWQVVSREGGKLKMYNYFNSKEKFENFKFLGLNNFDFFVSEFFKDEHHHDEL
jgi:hypothetical protein